MNYLLDTDTLVFYLRGHTEVKNKVLATPISVLCTSSVCIGELYYGAAKSQQPFKRKAEVDSLRATLPVIVLGEPEAERFGTLKAELESRGGRLPDADLMIAATALENELTVVTSNTKHFSRIQGLSLDDWTSR